MTLKHGEFQRMESGFFSTALPNCLVPDKLEKVVLVEIEKWEKEEPREDKLRYWF